MIPAAAAWRFYRRVGMGFVCALFTTTLALAQAPVPIPQSNWRLRFVDSQDLTGGLYLATNSFDGNPDTFWHTRWNGAEDALPHEIQIDLGAAYTISGFQYLPRQDGTPNGRIAQYEFYVSADGATWGSAVAAGMLANVPTQQQVLFASAKNGRYVRLRALSEVDGRPFTSMAELNVLAPSDTLPPTPTLIPQANWALRFVDSQDLTGGLYLATNSFDGNPNTFWHTTWNGSVDPLPHEIQIDLGATYSVAGFRYLPRQDGTPNGRIAQYELYVSADGTTWGSATAAGTLANVATEQQVLFASPKAGRYVRLRALSEVSGLPFSSMAELNILQSSGLVDQPPESVITAPAGAVTIAPGQSVVFNGSGTDPENDTPLTYAWNFGVGGPPPSTLASPGPVVFPAAGVYTVTFTVTDSLGHADPTPATRTVTVQTTLPANLIPRAGWTLRFVDSEETVVENDAAVNAFDGDPGTFWETRWAVANQPPPPHEIQIDLGATYPVSGFVYLPRQNSQFGRVGDYEFYVSVDGTTWGNPVAAGSFPDTNSSEPAAVSFTPKSGRYVRFRGLTGANGDSQSSIAELYVIQTGTGANQAPLAGLDSPNQNLTISVGTALLLSGSASDPDGNLPLTYRWSVRPGSGITDSTALVPGWVHFDRTGTYVVRLAVTDALGATAVASRTINVVGGALVPHAGWTLRFVDSQETVGSNTPATNAFDGDPNTFWHTQWLTAQPPPPHEIQIDLGVTHTLVGFRYLPRQDGTPNGGVGQYEFYVSADGTRWGSPVAAGTFLNSAAQQEVQFNPIAGRYVRLRALTEANGGLFTSVAELDLLERQCATTPSVRLLQPRSGALQTSSTLQVRTDACLVAGQGVRIVVDGGTQLDLLSPPYNATLTNLALADHLIEAYVIDGAGARVSGPSAYDLARPVGIGDAYVALGDGVTFGGGDDVPSDDNPQDGRTTLGAGYPGILADLLTAAAGHPVVVANEGVAGTGAAETAVAMPSVLAKYPDAQRFLLFTGHNDYLVHHTPSGFGLHPGQAGYDGSFKDNVQRIINAVNAAGKTIVLAKAPPVLPVGGEVDAAVQQYNAVIDELAADPANAIPVAPPDFHTFFESRTTTEYSDSILLNGLGYRSMAGLWRNALLP